MLPIRLAIEGFFLFPLSTSGITYKTGKKKVYSQIKMIFVTEHEMKLQRHYQYSFISTFYKFEYFKLRLLIFCFAGIKNC